MLWPTYTQEKTDWGKSIVDGYAKAQPGTTIDGIFTGALNTTDPYTKLTAMVAAGATMPTDDWTFPDAIALAQKLTKADQGQYGISLDWG